MPINWNEVDKARLEYIQNKEAVEAKYKKECLARSNSFFKFIKPKKPKELDYSYYDSYQLYKDQFIYINGDNIVSCNLCFLSSESINNIFKYLSPVIKSSTIDIKGNLEEIFFVVIDTEENRKKIDKVVAFIEKYLDNEKAAQETRQKEAEAFIDNYINNKDTK